MVLKPKALRHRLSQCEKSLQKSKTPELAKANILAHRIALSKREAMQDNSVPYQRYEVPKSRNTSEDNSVPNDLSSVETKTHDQGYIKNALINLESPEISQEGTWSSNEGTIPTLEKKQPIIVSPKAAYSNKALYCRKCGKLLLKDSNYCSFCGERVNLLDELSSPDKSTEEKVGLNEHDRRRNPRKKRRKTAIRVALFFLAGLAILSIVGYSLFRFLPGHFVGHGNLNKQDGVDEFHWIKWGMTKSQVDRCLYFEDHTEENSIIYQQNDNSKIYILGIECDSYVCRFENGALHRVDYTFDPTVRNKEEIIAAVTKRYGEPTRISYKRWNSNDGFYAISISEDNAERVWKGSRTTVYLVHINDFMALVYEKSSN